MSFFAPEVTWDKVLTLEHLKRIEGQHQLDVFFVLKRKNRSLTFSFTNVLGHLASSIFFVQCVLDFALLYERVAPK